MDKADDVKPAEVNRKLSYSDLSGVPLLEAIVYGEDKAESDNQTREKHKCVACQKQFTTVFSLQRHRERFRVCADWKEDTNTAALINAPSAFSLATDLIEKAIQYGPSDKNKCIFCYHEFSSAGNFHRHFENSVACNAKAYKAIKEAFAAQYIKTSCLNIDYVWH